MPSPRQELAAQLLGAGARLRGVALSGASQEVLRLRWLLQSGGVKPGQVVGLNGVDPLVAIPAVWAEDAVPRPLPRGAAAGCHHVLQLDGLLPQESDWPFEPDLTALLHETSGSSSVAKLARRSVASVLEEAGGYRKGLALCADDKVMVPVPVLHSFGSGVALSALLNGCDVLAESGRLPSAVAADLDGGVANKIAITPPLAQLLVATRRRGGHAIDAMLVGAGVLPQRLASQLAERFEVDITVGYGSTETGGTFIGANGLGAPINGIDVVWPPIGEEGQLVLRTPTAVLGYADENLRTSKLWRTGDIVLHEACGTVRFVRRTSDDRIRLNGSFVDVAPLREAIERIPAVTEHVFVVAPANAAEGIDSLYLLLASRSLDRSSLYDAVRAVDWRGPTVKWVTCRSLPRNSLGKLDRAALAQLVSAE